MDLANPERRFYAVEVLTQWFQVSGMLTPLGDFASFLNDPQRATLTIEQAQALPLQASWRVGSFSGVDMVIPKSEVHLLFCGDSTPEEMRLLPHTEQLVVYSSTYAINGHFHTGPETRVADMFYLAQGPFFPASDAEVYSLLPLNAPVSGSGLLTFVNKHQVSLYYPRG